VSGRYHVVGLHSLLVASGSPYLFICNLLFLSRIMDYRGYVADHREPVGDMFTSSSFSVSTCTMCVKILTYSHITVYC
jgi:hypothetical protein